MEISAVLFDFGSTLFAHAPLAHVIRNEAAALGHDVTQEQALELAARIERDAHSPDELAHQRDLDASVWAERWPTLYAVGDDEMPGLGAAIHRSMHAAEEWVPFALTAAVLSDLAAAGVPVAVVSNTGWDIRTVFAHHDLQRYVRTFVLSCEVGVVKPSPTIFLKACAELGSEPSRTLMVGDDPVADAGASRAGLPTLLLPTRAPGGDNGLDAVTRIAIVR